MSEMVERVARALEVADGCGPDDPAYIRFPGAVSFGLCWRDKYADKARAAIAAMREPTDAMTAAADDLDVYPLGSSTPSQSAMIDEKWQAMIDAALDDTSAHGSIPSGNPHQRIGETS